MTTADRHDRLREIYLEVVDLGLKWLKHHQNPDGYWSCAGFDEMCGTLGNDVICSGTGNPLHDVGVTGHYHVVVGLYVEGGGDFQPVPGVDYQAEGEQLTFGEGKVETTLDLILVPEL